MKARGFLSAMLVLIFVVLTTNAYLLREEFVSSQKNTNKLLLEMEKASFVRTELETNFDFLVAHSMQVFGIQSIDSNFLKEKTSKQIENFIIQSQQAHSNTTFFISKKTQKEQEFSSEKLKDLFSIHVKQVGKLYQAEFNFHGGKEKNHELAEEIEFENFLQRFFIVSGYQISTLGISVGG